MSEDSPSAGAHPKEPSEPKTKKVLINKIVRRKENIPTALQHVRTCKEMQKHKYQNDYWIKQPGAWVRVHRKPRRTLFVPTGTQDGPPVGDLESARITDVYVVYSNEHREVRDRWNNHLTASKELPYRWTGSTVFQLKTKDSQQPRICLISDVLNEVELQPVSYTHLTLPTICSV